MLAPGTEIGRYVVKRKLAEGGMAEIYLASAVGPEGFSKDVAIKVVRSFLATDQQFVQMFIAEARLASRLNHANVVQIFDFGKHEDTYYLAMEYVRGASLWDLRQRCRRDGVPFPPVLAAELGTQIARGLHYAHSLTEKGQKLGVVHRDVTPHNVLLSFEGAVKLTDFGIAKAQTTHTAPGMLKGKFAYMSPEQARGEPVDARTDIFALGIVLWELLTGGKLFDGESELAVLRAVESSVIAPPSRLNPDVSQELSDIVMKALARPLPERFQSAFEFEKALATWVRRSAQSMEETSVALFLQQVYGAEALEEARPGTPAHGAAAVARPDATVCDDDFGTGDTLAVDPSRLSQRAMTMTPLRPGQRHATPRPRGVMDDPDPPPARTEEFRPPTMKATEQMPAVSMPHLSTAPRKSGLEPQLADTPEPPARPKTEHYMPVSRRLEPLVIVDSSVEPSKVKPAPLPAPDTGSASASEAGLAPPDEQLDAIPKSRAPLIAGASLAVVGLLAVIGYFAWSEPSPQVVIVDANASPEAAPTELRTRALVEPAAPGPGPAVKSPDTPATDRPPVGTSPAPGDSTIQTLPPPEKPTGPSAPPGDSATPNQPSTTEPEGPKTPAPTPGTSRPGKKEDKRDDKPPPKAMGTLILRAIPYAQVTVSGRAPMEIDAPKPVPVAAGTFEVTFRHPKKMEKKKVTVKAGETVRLDFDANAP